MCAQRGGSMTKRSVWLGATLAAASILVLAGGSRATQEMGGQAVNVAEMKFASLPGLPTCAAGAVQDGDPVKGSSIILAKTEPGCTFPWHWHTPNERVMIVSGVGHVEMKDGTPVALAAGGFALMPSHHVHRFRCEGACQLYIYSDAAFDIHYVDGQGNEIAPTTALSAVNEMAAMQMR